MSVKPPYNDSDTLIALIAGDQRAFKIIYERYWQLLYVAAYKILKDEDECKDVVQEVFTSLLKKGDQLDVHGSLSAYLYTAVRYKVIDTLSKRKVRTDHELSLANYISQHHVATDRKLIESETIAAIEREVENLPKKMREIFELSRNQELSYKEISTMLDISDKTVKKQISNALKILRPKLTNYYTFLAFSILFLFKS